MKGAHTFRKFLNSVFHRNTPSTTRSTPNPDYEAQPSEPTPTKPKRKVKFRKDKLKDTSTASGVSSRTSGSISEHLASLVSSRSTRKQSGTPTKHRPKCAMPCTNLSDLPNELIQGICEEIDSNEDLYSFGFSCRRFCDCALGVYRSRNGIVGRYWGFVEDITPAASEGEEEADPNPYPDPSGSTKPKTRFVYDLQPQVALEGSYKAAVGTTSLDYDSHAGPPPPPPSHIPELFCILHFPESNLIWEIMGFMSLLVQVSTISKVIIQFHGLYVMDDAESLLDKKALSVMKLWTSHLIQDVLQVVLQKKGCLELVFELPQKDQTKLDRPIYKLNDLATLGSDAEEEPEWVLGSPAHYRRYPVDLRARSSRRTRSQDHGWSLFLQSFTISSSTLLFQEPFLLFTMQTMNHHHSTLHELRLHGLSLPPAKWNTFFSRISIPTLRSLVLVSCNVPFVDLSGFLGRHEGLEMLKVEAFDVIGEPKDSVTAAAAAGSSSGTTRHKPTKESSFMRPPSRLGRHPLLPKLTTLIAPLDYAIRLLSPSLTPESSGLPLPSLSSLTLITSASFDSDLRHEEQALSSLSTRLLVIPSITLRIYLLRVYEGDPPLNHLRLFKDSGKYLQLYPNLTSLELVGTFLPPSFYYSSSSWIWSRRYGLSGSRVRVRTPNAELDIPLWLSHFKNVKNVLISQFAYLPAKGGWRWGMQSVMEKVKTTCPWIETVYVEARE
ncbi:hypothetical protein BDN72DRAFT_850916 [Pluteus cervinus]|uniref:Uncharacterized protein n=1 Tax=Pluteus cervinus TaxID=181527 RepID=A0ACD3A2T9_9AGAR|nr:hypothetical protein BDN72DRAFT_850916 [Pluteus cervinus]